jgi:predicted Zn finger-like uncharacterized protein
MELLRANLSPRPPSDGIRRVGFRKWYERELLSSHAYMVLAILSMVAVAASFEAIRDGSPAEQMLDLLFVIVSAGIGMWSLRRYLFLLLRAEGVANQARCKDCGAYGRFRIVAEDCSHNETQVRCSRCEHLWTICT